MLAKFGLSFSGLNYVISLVDSMICKFPAIIDDWKNFVMHLRKVFVFKNMDKGMKSSKFVSEKEGEKT